MSPPPNVCHKACRRLHYPRGAYRSKDGASIQRLDNSLHFKRYFPEPANVRTDAPSTLTSRYFGGRFIGSTVLERRPPATITPALEELALHMHKPRGTCLLMQVIHVLRAQEEPLANRLFQLCQRQVSRIRP